MAPRGVWSLLACLAACAEAVQGDPAPTQDDPDSPASDTDVGTSDAPADTDPARLPPNILVVVLDDVGVDAVSTYAVQPTAPATPTLDRLAAEGVRFDHAWAMPTCMPTRAALLTGRLPSRTGIGTSVGPYDDSGGLPLAERTIAELLHDAPVPYTTSAIGKWHVSASKTGGVDAPNLQGFDHYRGALGNLLPGHVTSGETPSYTRWQETEDGEQRWRQGYVTTAEVDDALVDMRTMPEPWFEYLAFHAAHAPFGAAPDTEPVDSSKAALFEATVTALDAELGRLLDELGDDVLARTIVIVLGDNGTPPSAERPPFSGEPSKFSVFEGGVRVPFLVRWPGVARPGAVSDALISVTDVLPTIAAAAGIPASLLPLLDGEDLAPMLRTPSRSSTRDMVYTEEFEPNGVGHTRVVHDVSVFDGRWKLIRTTEDDDKVFDLAGREIEGAESRTPLGGPAYVARARLRAGLEAIQDGMRP